MPTASGSRAGSRRRELGRSRDLGAGAVQRDRLRRAHRAGLRHQDLRHGDRPDAHRSPTARASNESPAYSPNGRHLAFASTRLGQTADLHHRPRRQRPASGHEGRQQLSPELVSLELEGEMPSSRPAFPLASTARLGDSRSCCVVHCLRSCSLSSLAAATPAAGRSRPSRGRRPRHRRAALGLTAAAPPEPVVEPPPVTVPPEPTVESSDLSQPIARRDQQAVGRCSPCSTSSTAPR